MATEAVMSTSAVIVQLAAARCIDTKTGLHMEPHLASRRLTHQTDCLRLLRVTPCLTLLERESSDPRQQQKIVNEAISASDECRDEGSPIDHSGTCVRAREVARCKGPAVVGLSNPVSAQNARPTDTSELFNGEV